MPRTSRGLQGRRVVVVALLSLASTAVLAQADPSSMGAPKVGAAEVRLSIPNGYLRITQEDLSVESTGGPVRWTRIWDGYEWKFNPHWESLSQSWRNLTGSKSADTTGSTVNGGGTSSDTPPGEELGVISGPEEPEDEDGCWVWVDDDWEPSVGTVVIGGMPQAGPMIPGRAAPFNNLMGAAGSSDYSPGVRVNIDYANLCVGALARSGVQDLEAIRRQNELYVGEEGRFAFSNRAVLEKRDVEELPRFDATGVQQLSTGSIVLAPVTNSKGYRWIHKEGDWIDYNTQGQVVAYGDGNDNIVWLARDPSGAVRGAVDATGHVLYTLHYTSGRLTEVRDYPIPGEELDLPARSVQYQYDEKNRMTHVIDARGNTIRYDYDGMNRIVSITDQEGRIERFDYTGHTVNKRTAPDETVTEYLFEYDDANKQFTSKITGPDTPTGRRVEDYTHNRSGKLVRRIVNGRIEEEVRYDTGARTELHTNARGFVSRTTYNEFDQLIRTDHPDGSNEQIGYSPLHLQPTEQIDEAGVKTQYQYDTKGNLLKKIEAVGTTAQRTIDYEINSLGQTTRITVRGRTESNGVVTPDASWIYEYDSKGQVRRVTDPEGHARQYTFNRAGRLVRFQDAKNQVTRYTVDAHGNLLTVLDALGREIVYTYDRVGNLLTQTDARDHAYSLAYDAMNRPSTLTYPAGGGTARVQYDGRGMPLSQTDADGRTENASFDPLRRLARYSDGMGNQSEYGYDLPDGSIGTLSAPTEVKYPTFTERRRYDRRERLTSRTLVGASAAANELTSSTAYDKRGLVQSETYENGEQRAFAYDALRRLTELTDRLGGKTLGQYDVRDNLLELRDPKGHVYRFKYDRNDRLVEQTLPLGQVTTHQYDANGNRTQTIDPVGTSTVGEYDAANRLIRRQITRAGQSQPESVVTFDYDDNDNLIGWTDGPLSGVLTYDENNRKLSETVNYGDGQSLSYGYTYTAAGYKRTLSYPDGTLITYTHDLKGELASVEIPGEGIRTVNEWNWREPKQVTLPGGTIQTRSHDGLLNLTGLQVKNPAQQRVFTLENGLGEIEELDRRAIDGVVSQYTYDDDLHLTEVSGAHSEELTYDPVGNRLTQSGVSGAWIYDDNNRLLQAGNDIYEYDAAGNLIRRTVGGIVTRFKYDGLNRLIEIQDDNGVARAQYRYDPFHRRLWKDVAGVRTYYLHGDEGLLAEANAAGAITELYGWKPDGKWGTDPLFIRAVIGSGPSAQVGYAYFHTDHLGAPWRATDRSGQVVWSAEYREFGSATVSMASVLQVNLRLPGQYFDRESGLLYNWHRYYDSRVGRYIGADPIGLQGGINVYAYAFGNPLHFIDPSGLHCLSDCQIKAITGAVGGGISGLSSGAAGAAVGLVGGAVMGFADCVGFPFSTGGVANIALNGALAGGATESTGNGRRGFIGGAVGGIVGGAWGMAAGGSIYDGTEGGAVGGAVGSFFGTGTGKRWSGRESYRPNRRAAFKGGFFGGVGGLAAGLLEKYLKDTRDPNCSECAQ